MNNLILLIISANQMNNSLKGEDEILNRNVFIIIENALKNILNELDKNLNIFKT